MKFPLSGINHTRVRIILFSALCFWLFSSTALLAQTSCATPWAANVYYAAGTEVSYNGENYTCIISHTAASNWYPPVVPALWSPVGACTTGGATPTPTPKPTATPTPTAKPTATATATPKPTATPTATPKPTATPTATAKPTATATPGNPCAPAWSASAVYTGGMTASVNGQNYTAAYWTQGNNPATTSGPAGSGQPWIPNGPCGGSATPTPTATVTPTSTPRPTATPTATATATPSGKVLIGYFPEWGPGGGYYAKNIITSGSAPLLTIINYAFANVTNNACALTDPNADYQQTYNSSNSVDGSTDGSGTGLYGSFHQLQELKAKYPNLKVLISIGGGSGSAGFSAAAQPANVSGLVSSCINMFINGNVASGVNAGTLFDGIDIDWEWPTSSDTQNYVNMIALFRSQLSATRPGLMLTVAGSPGSYAYVPQDLAAIAPYLNYINIEAYDYDGPWTSVTNFVAPLYAPSGSPNSASIDATLQGYLATGVPASKLTLGFPFYAYDWTAVPNVNNGLYQTATADQNGGTYAQIVQIMGSYQQFRDPTSQEPWLFNGSTFWTYDDPTSIAFKMNYLKTKGLAGAMFWELAQDTPSGTLIQAVHNGLQ